MSFLCIFNLRRLEVADASRSHDIVVRSGPHIIDPSTPVSLLQPTHIILLLPRMRGGVPRDDGPQKWSDKVFNDGVKCVSTDLSKDITKLSSAFRAQVQRLIDVQGDIGTKDAENALVHMAEAWRDAQTPRFQTYLRDGDSAISSRDNRAVRGAAFVVRELMGTANDGADANWAKSRSAQAAWLVKLGRSNPFLIKSGFTGRGRLWSSENETDLQLREVPRSFHYTWPSVIV